MYLCRKSVRFLILCSALLVAAGCEYRVVEPTDIGDIEVSFRDDVMPIFEKSCTSCHATTDDPPPILKSEVAYQEILGGGYVIPGNAEESLFYKRLIGDPDIKGGRTMPPAEPLPDSEIQLINQWIEQGARDDSGEDGDHEPH